MDVIAFLPGDGLRSTGRVDEVLPLIVDRVFHFNFQRQIPNVLAVTQSLFVAARKIRARASSSCWAVGSV